jgi:hypothetical protein
VVVETQQVGGEVGGAGGEEDESDVKEKYGREGVRREEEESDRHRKGKEKTDSGIARRTMGGPTGYSCMRACEWKREAVQFNAI